MNKRERIGIYTEFIKNWVKENGSTLDINDRFALLETKGIPYGVLLTNKNNKTKAGKEVYTILKGSTIPLETTVSGRVPKLKQLLSDGIITRGGDRFIFIKDYKDVTIGSTRRLVNGTDGRAPIPLYSINEVNNEFYKFKVRINNELNIEDTHIIIEYKGVKIRFIQGLFIINDIDVFTTFDDVLNYLVINNKINSTDECIEALQGIVIKVYNQDKTDKVKEAEHALTSDKTEEVIKANEAVVAENAIHAETADKASKLSDEQKLEIKQQAENIAQQTYEENKRKEQLELEEKLKTFVYKYQTFEDYNDKELEYNKQKLESALTMLSRDKTVYVTGKSRSGKTFLCREIAGKFCNIDTTDFENHAKFAHNLMWIKATMSEEVFIQKFAEFCVHNKNAEKCLIVINEAKKDNLYNLLPMWEKMDADGKKYKDFLQEGLTFECNGVSIEVPKGLCILANVADGQNIDDLEQVLNRFNHNRIDMNDISEDLVDISKFTNIPLKVLSLLSEIQSEIIEETENDSKSFIVVYLLKYDKLNTLKKCLKSIKKDLYLWEDDDRVTELESYISKLEDNSDELQF